MTFSSEPPVARRIPWVSGLEDGEGRGERARQRTAEAWALKRKESANWTVGDGVESSDNVAVMPCRTRS